MRHFPEDTRLCPMEDLKEYKKQTCKFCLQTTQATRQYADLTNMIGHGLMAAARVDTSIFSTLSTRGTATSKAKTAWVPTANILKAAIGLVLYRQPI